MDILGQCYFHTCGHMTGHKVVVCKCGCLKTMESSGSWLLPTMNHSLCSDPIVSLQSLSSELGLITG